MRPSLQSQDGNTPLKNVLLHRHNSAVTLLIEGRANLDIPDKVRRGGDAGAKPAR